MFEDINPSGDKKDLEKCILEDIKMLGVEYSKISYTSDYFGQIFEFGKTLITKGLAYVDNTDL